MPFPVDEDRVIAAEEELGRRLPEDLRRRLMRDNGGEAGSFTRSANGTGDRGTCNRSR